MDWSLYSFVHRSKQRRSVLLALHGRQLTPTQIAAKTDMQTSNVSRALKALESKDLIKCLTPDERIGKFYTLTEAGSKMVCQLRKDKDAEKEQSNKKS